MHSISSVRKKRRLRVQNRSAGCVPSCTNLSRRQEIPMFCLRKQGISVPSPSLRSEHCPLGIYSSWALIGRYESGDIGNPISRWLIHHQHHQVLLCHQSQFLKTLDLVGLKFNEGKSDLDPVQDIQFLGIRLHLDQG